MIRPPKIIGAIQAVGLVAYVVFVATIMQTIAGLGPDAKLPNPTLGIALFLLLFSTSALMCGAITLGYPIVLFFARDKKREALETIAWTIVWLVFVAIVLVLYLVLTVAGMF